MTGVQTCALPILDIGRLQKLIENEYEKDESIRDIEVLGNLERQLGFAKNALTTYTAEYTKLLGEQKTIHRDLKATRDQRVKKVEDSKSTFAGYLRLLEDDDFRKKEGDKAELLRLSSNKAKQELSEWHEFADHKLDQPFLSEQTRSEERRVG